MCIEFYECYPVFLTIMKSFLAMALRERITTSAESRLLLKRIQQRGRHHEISHKAAATFIVDYDLVATEPEAARGQNLAQSLNELVIFDEFTTGTLVTPNDETG